jgi:deoxyribose-phosphate aldolase
MARALREHNTPTGERRGLKPPGGIRTANAALDWLALGEAELGPDWVTRDRFRIGASGLLDDLVRRLTHGEHS